MVAQLDAIMPHPVHELILFWLDSVIPTGAVVRQQHLQNKLPGLHQRLGLRPYDHAIEDRKRTGWLRMWRALHFDQTQATGAGRRKVVRASPPGARNEWAGH